MHILKKNSYRNLCFFGLLLVIMAMVGCSGLSTPTASSMPVTATPASLIELTVCAGVGLTDVIKSINDLYMQENESVTIIANFAAAGTLQQQIEQGAPADVFFSPGVKQMDALQDNGLIINETRRDLLNNKIVLVVPSNSNLGISSFMDLLNDNISKIAIGDPEFVPAGTYGKQALEQLGIYEQVQLKLILCSDVRQVLGYVEAGNADAGIVYSTDAAITDNVKIAADAPDEVNSQIVYPVAVIKASQNVAAAKAYIAFLFSDEAKAIFEQYGFVVVNK